MCNVKLRRVPITIVAEGKQLIITYSECVFVASCIQRAKRIRRNILQSLACPAEQFFYIIS